MTRSIRILLQASIPYTEDDWHVGRFSLLREELSKVADVLARNREPDARGDDPILSKISRSDFDELWLLGVDGGTALSTRDCAAIDAFHKAGGGILTAGDHQNMGMWLRRIGGVGAAHYFHNPEFCEPDPNRLSPDDRETATISWPNYHSGSNGDLQPIPSPSSRSIRCYASRHPQPNPSVFFQLTRTKGRWGFRRMSLAPKPSLGARAYRAAASSTSSSHSIDALAHQAVRSRNRAFITSPITTGTSREERRASSPKNRGTRYETNLERWMTFGRTCAMRLSGWHRRVLRRVRPLADERLASACGTRRRQAVARPRWPPAPGRQRNRPSSAGLCRRGSPLAPRRSSTPAASSAEAPYPTATRQWPRTAEKPTPSAQSQTKTRTRCRSIP